MRTPIAVALGLIVVALVGASAYREFGTADSAAAQTETKPAAPAAVPVVAGTAETRDMPVYVRGIGSVQAFNLVAIKSRVDGQIVKVAFTEGQEVKAGDPLFQIDPRPFQAALAQAQANQQKDQAQLVSAQADLKRDEELVAHSFQTRQAFDQQTAMVGQLQAAIKADQALIEAAQLNLQYADIRSPIDGRTGARLVDIGNIVHATDAAALVTVAQVRPIFVSFTLPQANFEVVRAANGKGSVEIQAVSASDQKQLASGKLSLIDNQIEQSTGTIHLKAQFDNLQEALWPGEFVNVRVVVGVDKDSVTVPAEALQRGPKGQYLFVIKPDMTVELRDVEVAQTESNVAVISKGLAAGERIVVEGQYRLEQGTKVTPKQEAPKTSS
jgi:membrane fusion protein, multidrug efflux system